LGGGGYGSWGDTAGRPIVPSTYVPKSNREKDLEKDREAASGDQRRRLDRELDDLRRARQREESRLRMIANRAEIEAREWEQQRRLRSGSRFNLHHPNGVPPSLTTPEAIMSALDEFVDFSRTGPPRGAQQSLSTRPPDPTTAVADASSLRKGMSEQEVDRLLGAPQSRKISDAAGLPLVNATYELPASTVTAQFVNGVLAKFTISSK